MKQILITGSSGFVGQHLLRSISPNEFEITKLDIKEGYNITDWNSIKNIKNFDILIHLAARTFVPDSYKYPYDFYNTNVIGTLNCLELCRRNSAKLIFASSYVYGYPKYLPVDETHALNSFNPYSESKIIGERLCERYFKDFQTNTIILRPFNIYGIGQPNSFLIPSIIKQIGSGEIIVNDITAKRDFVYIKDVVEAYLKAIYLDIEGCEKFNICMNISYSVAEIIDIIENILDINLIIKDKFEKRINDIDELYGDNSKARKILNWDPNYNIHAGLKDMLKDYTLPNKK